MSQEDPTLSHRHFKRKKAGLDPYWTMPNVLVEFMSHLPKTAQALPVKSLLWLTRRAATHLLLLLVATDSILPSDKCSV